MNICIIFERHFFDILNIVILRAVFCSLFLGIEFYFFYLGGLIYLFADQWLHLTIDLLSGSKETVNETVMLSEDISDQRNDQQLEMESPLCLARAAVPSDLPLFCFSVILGEFPSKFLKYSFHFCILSFWLAAFSFVLNVLFLPLVLFIVCHAFCDCISSTEFLILSIWPIAVFGMSLLVLSGL